MNTVKARFLLSRFTKTSAKWRIDYGQQLIIEGIDLPHTCEVDFCNEGDTTTTTQLATDGVVTIPDAYLLTGKNIEAYIYLHTGESDGETVYKISIPVNMRPARSNLTPTPVQQSAIEEAITALNTSAEEAAASAESAAADAERAEAAAASIDEQMIAAAVAEYLDDHPITVEEEDPTVPEWAKQPEKPSYTAQEVDAVPSEPGKGLSTNDYTTEEKQKLAGIEAGADKTPDLSGFATKTELAEKVDKVNGKGLSTNDYTTEEKNKLSGIEAGAQVNPDLSHYVTDSEYNPASKTSDMTQSVGKDSNGKLWTAPGGQSITVDSALSDSSENPVQNKAIKAALDGKLGTSGDGSNVTASFTISAQRTAIATGEKLSVIFGKILKWLSDLGTAAFKSSTSSVTQNSTDLIESGAVYTGLAAKYEKPSGGIPDTDIASAATWNAKGTYSKPSGGIPDTDLSSAVQTSLGKADSAYQKPSGGIPASDLAAGVIPTVPSAATAAPADLGTAAAGSSSKYAKEDHVHNKPTYTAADVGAVAADQGAGNAGKWLKVDTDGSVITADLPVYSGGVS